jgi:hypothetical protein
MKGVSVGLFPLPSALNAYEWRSKDEDVTASAGMLDLIFNAGVRIGLLLRQVRVANTEDERSKE